MSSEAEPDLWPIRPHPRSGEVFTGWLARIAQGLGLEPGLFFAYLRRSFRLSADRDLDMNPSYELLAEVSRRTTVRYNRLVVMTLRWHVHPFFATDTRNDRSSGFGFCSLCWRADPAPYIRRAWRLPWMACDEHRIPLRWQCPACRRSTSMENLRAVPPLPQCARCDFDLRNALPVSWPGSIAPQQVADILDTRRKQFEDAEALYLIGKAPEPEGGHLRLFSTLVFPPNKSERIPEKRANESAPS